MLPAIITSVLLVVSTALIPYQDAYKAQGREFEAKTRIYTLEEKIDFKSEFYKIDANLVKKIIKCESGFNPEAKNINKNKTIDYSYWQINEVHMSRASKLGYDITSPEDNLEFGFILMKAEGAEPWKYSKHCWDNDHLASAR